MLPYELRDPAQMFVTKYKPELTVNNFHSKGIKFDDGLDQTVVLVLSNSDGKYFRFVKAQADIFVLVEDGMLLGWVHRSSVIDAGDEFMMPVGSLNRMPKDLRFAQECKHLSYFGGVKVDSDHFTCFGCGKEVVN